MDSRKYCTPDQAVELLGVKKSTFYNRIKQHPVRSTRFNGRSWYNRQDIENLAALLIQEATDHEARGSGFVSRSWYTDADQVFARLLSNKVARPTLEQIIFVYGQSALRDALGKVKAA